MKRHDAREQAFLILFERSFKDESLNEIIENAQECRTVETDDYAARLLQLSFDNLNELDKKIDVYSNKWKLDRIPKVTLSLLRLSLCEIENFPDIPVSVTINEAVELAKKYSTEDDASFINGLLGTYVKQNPPQKE